jgi:hypothetical protein
MAIKTFTTGEVLTASDTNTYLANSGLVYVATVSPSAGSTIQFTNAFSNTYKNYRVIISGTASAGTNVYTRLLVGSTVQTGNILSVNQYNQLSAATIVKNTRADQYGLMGAMFPTYTSTYVFDFYNPQIADYTNWLCNGIGGRSSTDSDYNITACRNIATTQIDGFEITTAGAPTISITATIYGVRNA